MEVLLRSPRVFLMLCVQKLMSSTMIRMEQTSTETCGSTHIEVLQKYVVDNGLDIGFAYDGDADRCIAVDHKRKYH